MKGYADNYFDLAIVDPPYGIKWSERTDKSFVDRHNKTKAFKSNMEWDIPPNEDYWNELRRVSKNGEIIPQYMFDETKVKGNKKNEEYDIF